jgi:hypothetical protein
MRVLFIADAASTSYIVAKRLAEVQWSRMIIVGAWRWMDWAGE